MLSYLRLCPCSSTGHRRVPALALTVLCHFLLLAHTKAKVGIEVEFNCELSLRKGFDGPKEISEQFGLWRAMDNAVKCPNSKLDASLYYATEYRTGKSLLFDWLDFEHGDAIKAIKLIQTDINELVLNKATVDNGCDKCVGAFQYNVDTSPANFFSIFNKPPPIITYFLEIYPDHLIGVVGAFATKTDQELAKIAFYGLNTLLPYLSVSTSQKATLEVGFNSGTHKNTLPFLPRMCLGEALDHLASTYREEWGKVAKPFLLKKEQFSKMVELVYQELYPHDFKSKAPSLERIEQGYDKYLKFFPEIVEKQIKNKAFELCTKDALKWKSIVQNNKLFGEVRNYNRFYFWRKNGKYELIDQTQKKAIQPSSMSEIGADLNFNLEE